MTAKKVAILGGGYTGLLLGSLLEDATVFESESEPGGLCRSFGANGFYADIGPHILFSSKQELLQYQLALLGDNYRLVDRDSKCYFKGRWVDYPFENGINGLDEDTRYRFQAGYERRFPRGKSFPDWFRGTFGTPMAEEYFLPYNEKVWKLDPLLLDPSMVSRIPQPSQEDMRRVFHGDKVVGHQHQAKFYYPKLGGFQALTDVLAGCCSDLRLETPVGRVTSGRWGGWAVNDEHFDIVVSTIPIGSLGRALGQSSWGEATSYMPITVYMVGVSGKLDSCLSATISGGASFHRIYYPGRYSPDRVPDGCDSVCFEVSGPKFVPLGDVISEAVGMGVIPDRNSIVYADFVCVDKAYPRPTIDSTFKVRALEKELEEKFPGLYLCGRTGSHNYLNTDLCTEQALRMAERINAQ
jgi:protoporphyrinogen oxidase